MMWASSTALTCEHVKQTEVSSQQSLCGSIYYCLHWIVASDKLIATTVRKK